VLEHFIKGQPFVAHFRQDEVGRAIDDASQPLNPVGGEAFTQSLDDGDATGHSGFKGHHHTFFVGCSKNFCAMNGQQSFVGCDHVFA
jgi:hypothetical protein